MATSPEENFMPTAENIKPFVKDAVLLALCSPLNPSGTMFTEENLRGICELVIEENKSRGDRKPLYVMYDQIYWMLTFDGWKHVDPVSMYPEMKDYVIYIDGISKYFAATGVRVGYGYGPKHIIDKMKSILGHIGAWAPKAEQVAVARFLKEKEVMRNYVANNAKCLKASLDTLYNGIIKLRNEGYRVDAIAPAGAIYLTIKIDYLQYKLTDDSILKDAMDINSYLIQFANLALVPFNAFGNDKQTAWFRAAVGATNLSDIELGLINMKQALDNLKK